MTTTSATTASLDFDRCYRAVQSRDARFDGQFFVTVHTTGIYCRPSCPAQTPKPQNVHFVVTAAAAQQQGYRACRRCAPDAVPGSPRWNAGADLSSRAMRLIADGTVEREGVDGLAARLGYTTRHLNRVLRTELGAGPLALARAHRAGTARVLIQCTPMSMSDIAFAAGFHSVRQFNDTIRDVFGLTPTRLRALPSPSAVHNAAALGGVSLRLAHRQPLDTRWLRWFLSAHAAPGVEALDDGPPDSGANWRYRRVIRLPHGPALVTIEPADTHIVAGVAHLDMRDLGVAVNRLRRLLDLDADAISADAALRADPSLAPLIAEAPGLRVPGSVDAAETLVRTMIGQQISVKAARHHVRRLVAELGTPLPWPDDAAITAATAADTTTDTGPQPWMLFPDPATIAARGHEVLTGPRRRIDAIVATAGALAEKRVEPHAGCAASDLRDELLTLPGVGTWTADYVTMRVTGDPDTMLDHDLVVRRAADDLGLDLRSAARTWSPWRSYASMHLWRHRLSATEPMLTVPALTESTMSQHAVSRRTASELPASELPVSGQAQPPLPEPMSPATTMSHAPSLHPTVSAGGNR
ncbi:Ada metal-binding domain-containing protein [Gordonia sp. CPCC 206044]|uniref:DNA-3-methyladenine glycosylase 2 family protein n=1 Tax=Gordonia sp. CPCC 206044 TaxID=3140793 RepID=UPI003AF3342E